VTESDGGRSSDAKTGRAELAFMAATPNRLSAALPPREFDQSHNMEVGYWSVGQVETSRTGVHRRQSYLKPTCLSERCIPVGGGMIRWMHDLRGKPLWRL
jgi:hypothetical protein